MEKSIQITDHSRQDRNGGFNQKQTAEPRTGDLTGAQKYTWYDVAYPANRALDTFKPTETPVFSALPGERVVFRLA